MNQWVQSPALRIHMECVAACMQPYADQLDPQNKQDWIIAGLLHDFDYEKYPTASQHPFIGVEHLKSLSVNPVILDAIMGHADYTNTPRTTPMAKALFAVDELAGFIVACAKVRPNGISDLAPKSVKKKLKDKRFAEAVSRSDIQLGIEQLSVDPTEHIQTCIDAIRAHADRLGL